MVTLKIAIKLSSPKCGGFSKLVQLPENTFLHGNNQNLPPRSIRAPKDLAALPGYGPGVLGKQRHPGFFFFWGAGGGGRVVVVVGFFLVLKSC